MPLLTRDAVVALVGVFTLSIACGERESAAEGDTASPGGDTSELEEVDTEDVLDETPDAIVGPVEFLPQERWKPDTPPARELVEECWLRPFFTEDGVVAHSMSYLTAPDVAADGGRVYVVTLGPDPTDIFPTAGVLHAVDADGEELWRSAPIVHSLENAKLAIDRDGAIVAARANYARQFAPDMSFVAKLSPTGERLWDVRVFAHEDDEAEVRGLMTRVAVDDDNNIYFGIGLTVVSLSPDGELRWSHLLEARSSERTYAAGAPAVVGDTVWSVGGAGVYAFSRDGDIEVWRPGPVDHEPEAAEPKHAYRGLGAVLADGRVVASYFGAGVDVLDALGEIDWALPELPQSNESLVVAPSDLLVGATGVGVFAQVAGQGERAWRVYHNGRVDGPIVDDKGQLVALVGGHHLDLYDVQTGDRTGAYDIGRAGSFPLGVVLREGELIVPVMLEATDGRRVAALQCVQVPVGLPAPGLWSHKHGDQRLSRSYKPTPIEVDDPSPDPRSEAR